MKIFSSKKKTKIALLILLLLFLHINPITLYFYSKPIEDSTDFFSNLTGQVFVDVTTGCLDICLFRNYRVIPFAHASTFRLIKHNGKPTSYAKNNWKVFKEDKVVKGARPKDFVLVDYYLGTSNNRIYVYGTELTKYLEKNTNRKITFEPELN